MNTSTHYTIKQFDPPSLPPPQKKKLKKKKKKKKKRNSQGQSTFTFNPIKP